MKFGVRPLHNKMKDFIAEEDGWTLDGAKINDPKILEAVRSTIGRKGPLILEHKFYRAARGPEYFLFNEYSEFMEYLKQHSKAGDKMRIWMLCDTCTDDNTLAKGKYPDTNGRVPDKGAY